MTSSSVVDGGSGGCRCVSSGLRFTWKMPQVRAVLTLLLVLALRMLRAALEQGDTPATAVSPAECPPCNSCRAADSHFRTKNYSVCLLASWNTTNFLHPVHPTSPVLPILRGLRRLKPYRWRFKPKSAWQRLSRDAHRQIQHDWDSFTSQTGFSTNLFREGLTSRASSLKMALHQLATSMEHVEQATVALRHPIS